MKKAFFLFATIAILASCGNSDSNSSATDSDSDNGIGTGPRSTDEDTAAKNVYNPMNANGNMPDTSNSINIGTEKTGGTADTTKR
jgi:hypothetical protein